MSVALRIMTVYEQSTQQLIIKQKAQQNLRCTTSMGIESSTINGYKKVYKDGYLEAVKVQSCNYTDSKSLKKTNTQSCLKSKHTGSPSNHTMHTLQQKSRRIVYQIDSNKCRQLNSNHTPQKQNATQTKSNTNLYDQRKEKNCINYDFQKLFGKINTNRAIANSNTSYIQELDSDIPKQYISNIRITRNPLVNCNHRDSPQYVNRIVDEMSHSRLLINQEIRYARTQSYNHKVLSRSKQNPIQKVRPSYVSIVGDCKDIKIENSQKKDYKECKVNTLHETLKKPTPPNISDSSDEKQQSPLPKIRLNQLQKQIVCLKNHITNGKSQKTIDQKDSGQEKFVVRKTQMLFVQNLSERYLIPTYNKTSKKTSNSKIQKCVDSSFTKDFNDKSILNGQSLDRISKPQTKVTNKNCLIRKHSRDEQDQLLSDQRYEGQHIHKYDQEGRQYYKEAQFLSTQPISQQKIARDCTKENQQTSPIKSLITQKSSVYFCSVSLQDENQQNQPNCDQAPSKNLKDTKKVFIERKGEKSRELWKLQTK